LAEKLAPTSAYKRADGISLNATDGIDILGAIIEAEAPNQPVHINSALGQAERSLSQSPPPATPKHDLFLEIPVVVGITVDKRQVGDSAENPDRNLDLEPRASLASEYYDFAIVLSFKPEEK
jgi:hypothetical protein